MIAFKTFTIMGRTRRDPAVSDDSALKKSTLLKNTKLKGKSTPGAKVTPLKQKASKYKYENVSYFYE